MRTFSKLMSAATALTFAFPVASATFATTTAVETAILEAGPQSTTCNSRGQLCDTPIILQGPFGRSLIGLTAPTTHCSRVRYRVEFVSGFERGPRGVVQPPRVLYRHTTSFLDPGGHVSLVVRDRVATVRIFAEGTRGGCNEGQLVSWGVDTEISPLLN